MKRKCFVISRCTLVLFLVLEKFQSHCLETAVIYNHTCMRSISDYGLFLITVCFMLRTQPLQSLPFKINEMICSSLLQLFILCDKFFFQHLLRNDICRNIAWIFRQIQITCVFRKIFDVVLFYSPWHRPLLAQPGPWREAINNIFNKIYHWKLCQPTGYFILAFSNA